MAKPEEGEEITGYKIEGACPVITKRDTLKLIDESIFKRNIVNIGSGKAETGIELNSGELRKVGNTIIANITE